MTHPPFDFNTSPLSSLSPPFTVVVLAAAQPKPKRWARPDYGEGLEEAEKNMEAVDEDLDKMGVLLNGLGAMAVVRS